MATSKNVHALIKALTPNEKAYFRKFCDELSRTETDFKYLRLFEVLDGMVEFDKRVLQVAFAKEYKNRTLHVLVDYLARQLLKVLRLIDEPDQIDAEAEIQNMMQEADLMVRRGLYDEAMDHLKLARRKAEQYEVPEEGAEKDKRKQEKFDKPHLLLSIFAKEFDYIVAHQSQGFNEEVRTLSDGLQTVLKQYTIENKAIMTYYQIGALFRNGTRLERQKLDHLLGDWTDSLEGVSAIDWTFKVKYHVPLIKAIYARLTGDFGVFSSLMEEVVDVWRAHKHQIRDKTTRFIVFLTNYLSSLLSLEDYTKARGILDEADELVLKNYDEEAEFFQSIEFERLRYYMDKSPESPFEISEEAIHRIEKGLSDYENKINFAREFAFYYNLSLLHFFRGDLDKAIHWIIKIINYSKNDHRKDVQRFAEFLRLFYLHDQDQFDLISKMVKNLNRKLKYKGGVISKFEAIIFAHFNDDLIFTVSNKQKKEVFLKFQKRLLKWDNKNTLGYRETLFWAENNIRKLS